MTAVGVTTPLPMGTVVWFPPVAVVGALSIVISIVAFFRRTKAPQSLAEPSH
jgi:hypothetical protein